MAYVCFSDENITENASHVYNKIFVSHLATGARV